MDMSIIQINAESSVPIEQHFKVSAGPGAGKTRFLVNHIRNVLRQTTRLDKTRKVACITYTNVAVEIILERAGLAIERIEVGTIHSFLYKHVIKPYATYIAEEYDLNVDKLDGHDDYVFENYSFLLELKNNTQQNYIRDDNKLIEALRCARWKIDNDGNLFVKPDYPRKSGNYTIKNITYFEYKKMSWKRGVVHHDDVLFFGYQLISKYPFILQVLRAKFPYFFLDEFQDTNPIQSNILQQIGQEETVIGIIGDKAQSIYGFQGADPSQLGSFTLQDMAEYQILENYRSTEKIIDFLNCIRFDLHQAKSCLNGNGVKPILIVGKMLASLCKAQEFCQGESVCSLSRDNVTSNILKKNADINFPSENLLQGLYDADSNSERRAIVLSFIKALELAVEKRYREAVTELSKSLNIGVDKATSKKEALRHLNSSLASYDQIKEMSLINFYDFLKSNINNTLARPSRGRPKEFYEQHTYKQLAVCVKITDDNSLNRTTHKAKGAEFDNVILMLKRPSDLAFLFEPNLEGNEEHRINYVAVSRARKRLFISVPTLFGLSEASINRIADMLDIIEIPD